MVDSELPPQVRDDPTTETSAALRPVTAAAVTIAVIAVIGALYLAATLVIPVVLALLLAFLLRPALVWLNRIGMPVAVAAGLLIVSGLTVIALALSSLTAPALTWIDQLPETLREMDRWASDQDSAVAKVVEATDSMDRLTDVGTGDDLAVPVRVAGGNLPAIFLSESSRLLVSTVTVILLLFFLLVYGQAMVFSVASSLSRRRGLRLLAVMHHLERDYSRYIFTITLINMSLGLAQGLAMLTLGMPDPWLWGAMGALLNFIPYFGAVLGTIVVAVVSIASGDHWSSVLAPPLVYWGLTIIEGYLVTPVVLGHRFRLNPLAVLLGLLVWGWIWGVAGALLAVPMVMALKVISERVTSLRPLARTLGGSHSEDPTAWLVDHAAGRAVRRRSDRARHRKPTRARIDTASDE